MLSVPPATFKPSQQISTKPLVVVRQTLLSFLYFQLLLLIIAIIAAQQS
jgi:hypothetical protein